jgi:hypothetical protein
MSKKTTRKERKTQTRYWLLVTSVEVYREFNKPGKGIDTSLSNTAITDWICINPLEPNGIYMYQLL